MVNVVVAEKPSVARDLAKVLGANQRRDGFLEGNGWKITWALGHLATLKTPDEYDPSLKRWSLESLPFVPARFELKPVDEGGDRKAQLDRVAELCREADELVCATDAGREGELITQVGRHLPHHQISFLGTARHARVQGHVLNRLRPVQVLGLIDVRPAEDEAARQVHRWVAPGPATRTPRPPALRGPPHHRHTRRHATRSVFGQQRLRPSRCEAQGVIEAPLDVDGSLICR